METPSQLLMCGVTAAEIVVILGQQFPESPWSRLITCILPIPGSSALRLTPAAVAACLLGIVGGMTRVWCFRTLGRFFTWEIAAQDNHRLVTEGPYSIVRHPAYAGGLMVTVGNITLLTTAGSYFREAGLWHTVSGRVAGSLFVVYMSWLFTKLLGRMGTEDKFLKDTFGTQWEEWARRTPFSLIPFLY